MTPLLVFLGSLIADYGTSYAAIKRGLREGNPLLAASPVLVALVSAGAIIGPAEYFRGAGYAQWEPIYYVAAGVHFALAAWNTVLILRKGK